ncbi:Dipeptide transport system permease protein DppB [Pseudonocardia sp. Ae406_Ps2]|uniref:ABC transporter permease n=1 Tax=unclassified Pseudonocardia TaxID=2619320 RepID=UPI00094B63FA|nr:MULTISPECIES: ABC transporter permease [unclassified Pseudonocardia]OLM01296.1 Dipeptide transport system permease protein DppB [Pseudonocardia sp. Ae406_Ps2]OLM06907.1 Dipeptide transport system permease protein DppB [Pseudonocardia sp. Ae331_Ps2]OLM14083.1 Dipeptide transport system permease protein DppB [Pseudonocardia sp. Ae505_Ps2]OLM22869.1 Dipeptide transport system permease protein DppB [Pseudonocardia sp. Ae706_Ps2]OLM31261.1 Dipeptide transport system permease protein DppB [Pseudo
MIAFLVRRTVLLLLSLLVASLLVFGLLRLLSGDMAQVVAGVQATPEQVELLRQELGTDRPWVVQYLDWIGGAATGDFGRSALSGVSVSAELGAKLAVTAPLVAGSILLSVLVAVPLGVLAAVRHRSRVGLGITAVSQLGIALPTLWVGLVLVIVFAVLLGWLPAQGFPTAGWAQPGRALRSLVLPCVTLALAEGAVLLRFVRTATLGVLHQDFLRTARATGLTRTGALLRHGLRNAALPVVSVLGLQAAALLVGAVVVERVFSLPGVGSMLLTDVGNRDLVKVQGEVLLLTGAVLVIGFLVDVGHRLVDPRLRVAR